MRQLSGSGLLQKVNVVFLAVPSFAHGQYFEAFPPHTKPGTIVETFLSLRCSARKPRTPRSLRHVAEVVPEVQRFRDLSGTLGVPPTHEVEEGIQQWCKERLTLWNARFQTEGTDLGTRLLGLPVATGGVHEALMSECQNYWTQHVEPRTVFSDARCASGAHGLAKLVHEVRLEGVPINHAVAGGGAEPVVCGGRSGLRRGLVVRGHRAGNLGVSGI